MRYSLALVLAPILLAACGGSSRSDNAPPSSTVSAGTDSVSIPLQLILLQGSGPATLQLAWSQVDGPPVELTDLGDGAARVLAPGFNAELVFELTGSSAGTVVATDRKTVVVKTVRRDQPFDVVARASVGGPNAQLAAMAYEEQSMRLFVLDEDGPRIHVFDMGDPTSPQLAGELPVPSTQPGFTPGPPRALGAGTGFETLAVAYDNVPADQPGRVVLYDAPSLTEIVSIEVGPRPVDLESSFRGYLTTCAADPMPSTTAPGEIVDGRGSVTWIRMPFTGPGNIDPAEDVTTVDFSAFDGERAALLADGVRLPRPSIAVSEDLEPRAASKMRDSDGAWVALPANNAMAIVDFELGEVLSIQGLEQADFGGEGLPATATTDARFGWTVGRPEEVVSLPGVGDFSIPALDISALSAVASSGTELEFEFVAGMGPALSQGNVEPATFYTPAYQHQLHRVRVDRTTGEWTLLPGLPLVSALGAPITGLPNLRASSFGLAFQDELPLDASGQELPLDPLGANFTGVCRVNDEIWCSDARRPSIYRFGSDGVLIDRFVPAGSNAFGVELGVETLPAVYAQARGLTSSSKHQGFCGIAATDDGEIATIVGLPLDNPDLSSDASSSTSRILRVLLLDPATGNPSHEYALVMSDQLEIVRDLAWFDGALHVVMESQFCSGNRTLFRLDLSGATDLLALGVERPVVNAALETTLPENLGTAFAVPILPVARSVVSNLAASGIGEGTGFAMAPSADGLLLATSDSYRLWERLPLAGGAIGGVCTSFLDFVALTSIGQFSLTPRSFDPSSQDAGLGLRNEPVLGLRQVTELLRAPTLSSDMVYAIDGGLARQVPGSPGFDESVAARDLVLDTTVFSDAAELQSDSRIGELQVSSLDGDSDGDGIFESIHAFGGRSLMTFDTELAVLSDTGDSVDRELRRRDPMGLARYEALAPTSGARGVRAIPVTPTDNQIVVAFPGAGLVAIFDGSNPASPRFVGILPSQEGAQPVDLAGFYATLVGGEFVEMVLVLDRGNGTVDVIRRGPF